MSTQQATNHRTLRARCVSSASVLALLVTIGCAYEDNPENQVESSASPTDSAPDNNGRVGGDRPGRDTFCVAGRGDNAPNRSAPQPGPGWKIDLDESFNDLDPAVWTARDGEYLDHESSYLLADNVSTRGGRLRIQAKDEPAGGRSYTSGYIDTNDTYSLPDYFRAEVRAKAPMETGMWSAPLWFRPVDRSAGEIDLAETSNSRGGRPISHQSIHTDYDSRHMVATRRTRFRSLGDADGTRWHTYQIEKSSGLIRMWIDGQLTSSFCTGAPRWYDDYYEIGKRWSLRVNLQVGGWVGEPDATTDWSGGKTTMQVDYIRTWVPRGTEAPAEE